MKRTAAEVAFYTKNNVRQFAVQEDEAELSTSLFLRGERKRQPDTFLVHTDFLTADDCHSKNDTN